MSDIPTLREQYLSLVNQQLPEKAKEGALPVRFNHCFARIVLDNLFEGCWYDHLSRKQPAYRQLDESQLERGIAIAQTMLAAPKVAAQLNQNSLRWRGKANR